jgi:hypothetical protein
VRKGVLYNFGLLEAFNCQMLLSVKLINVPEIQRQIGGYTLQRQSSQKSK